MIKEAIGKLVEGLSLNEEEAEKVMGEIMRGEATPSQISAFLVALRIKGETVEEITGCARAMRSNVLRVIPRTTLLVDTCGTGGDGMCTFNISTLVTFVAAAAGLAVAKHGNRSVSSLCGSADLLQELGVKIDLGAEKVAACIDQVGMGFLFAPLLHPAMKYAMPTRKEIGLRTIFNILGPITNPAFARVQLLGVYDLKLTTLLAQVLSRLDCQKAMVIHGADKLDELSTTGPNLIAELRDGQVKTYHLDPQELGLPRAKLEDLKGGSPRENAEIALSILKGKKGPQRDVVLLNASALLLLTDKVKSWAEGLEMARKMIDSGKAEAKLKELVEFTNSN